MQPSSLPYPFGLESFLATAVQATLSQSHQIQHFLPCVQRKFSLAFLQIFRLLN